MSKETLQLLVQITILYSSLVNTGNFFLNLERRHRDLPQKPEIEWIQTNTKLQLPSRVVLKLASLQTRESDSELF